MTTVQECVLHSDPVLEPLDTDLAVQGEWCDVLAGVPLFDNLSGSELRLLIPYLRAYHARANTTLIEEGSPDNRLGIVLEGKITLYKEDGMGASKPLKVVTAGMWFGESSWVDNAPAWAAAIAETDTKLVLLSREDFFKMAGKHAVIGVRLLHKICRLLRLQLSQVRGQSVEYLG